MTDEEFEDKRRHYDSNQFHWNGAKGAARGRARMREEYHDLAYQQESWRRTHLRVESDIKLAQQGDEKAAIRLRNTLWISCAELSYRMPASDEVRALHREQASLIRAMIEVATVSKREKSQ